MDVVERLCHIFRIAPGTEAEFIRRHVEIWPEMVEAMHEAGFANYSLFRRGLEVIGYSECHPDVATALRPLRRARRRRALGRLMEGIVVDLTDEHGELYRYDEDWHLD